MSTRHSNRFDDLLFVAGALVGILVLSLGIVFLILGLTVGVREAEFFIDGRSRMLTVLGGLVLGGVGYGLRFARHRIEAGSVRQAVRHGGSVLSLAGLAVFLLGISAEQTNSAPYLTSMNQKAILVVGSLALIVVGNLVVRLAGRRIGW